MRRLLTILLLTVAATATAAENNQLFILDASGSMWGRIDGTPKITVAKEVMSGLVADLPADSKTGLLVYGHRRKGDCADIESLVGLGPLDRETMIERIQGLNPKGKTPITRAVKQAVEQLRQLEESASVVLVSDGLESCGGDPCEAVRSARESGVDFRLHVVGFDLGDADPAQLQCMAEAGGGEYHTAANAEELTGALEAAVDVKPGLVLKVTSNGEPTPADVHVYESGTEKRIQRGRMGDAPDDRYANPRRIALDPGTYDIRVVPRALDGAPEKTLTGIEIPEEGELERTVDFSDGKLALHVTANGENTPASVTIYKAGTDERVDYTNKYTEPDPVRLPPGDYDIEAEPREIEAPVKWLRGVTVAAGDRVEESIDFSTGQLTLHVTADGGNTPASVTIYKAGTDERVDYTNKYTEPDPVRLPPGDYDIEAEPRKIEAPAKWLRGVTVAAGEQIEESISFSTGGLELRVIADGENTPASVTIYEAGTDERVDYTNKYERPEVVRLPPGDYDVEVEPRKINAPDQRLRGITVTAGEVVNETVDFSEPSSTGGETTSSASQSEAESGSASRRKTQAPVDIPVTSRSRFGDEFDLDSLGRRLQGTWVEYYGAPASRKVWHVQGDRFELYEVDLEEGRVEKKTMQFELFAPCAINLVIEDESTGARSVQSVKVALGEEKSFADTAVAVETNDGVFACTGLEYYELDDSGCTEWKWDRLDDAWQSSPAECRIEDDKLVVGDTTLQKVGDIYAEDTSERYRLKRFESLEKAKAQLQQ